MEIFKVSIGNEDFQLPFDALYFKEQKTAEAIMASFDEMLKEGKVIEWKCEKVNVMSHEEAFSDMIEIADSLN